MHVCMYAACMCIYIHTYIRCFTYMNVFETPHKHPAEKNKKNQHSTQKKNRTKPQKAHCHFTVRTQQRARVHARTENERAAVGGGSACARACAIVTARTEPATGTVSGRHRRSTYIRGRIAVPTRSRLSRLPSLHITN